MTDGPARFGGRDDVVLVVVLDCADLDRPAAFWCGVLGYTAEASSVGHYRRLLPPEGNGVELLLQQVPEPKAAKNRVHLDLRVPDLEAEAARVVALGGRRVTGDLVVEGGLAWHVFTDPDGNEFCVLQPSENPA
ncbi:VOC family protein [Nonomuraea sp. KM88]|uniref:VOC family protein n=1 Tax=Nonomuraea sp. KM88 TaxID=3457427 RepID=UPI003FCDC277